jgi:hypothetical protein
VVGAGFRKDARGDIARERNTSVRTRRSAANISTEQRRRAVNPTISEIFNAVGLAWRDVRRVFDAIGNKVVIALIITVVFYIIITVIPYMTSKSTAGYMLAILTVLLTTTGQTFLITPYLIAVHRFIILGE